MNDIWLLSSSVQDFMPHGMCYLWQPDLVWLHVISDGMTTLAYWTIAFALAWLVLRARREVPAGGVLGGRALPYDWMFLAFGVFIVACGTTHAVGIWTVWEPRYWLEGSVKAVTALASIAAAVALPPLVPRAVDLLKQARESEARRIQLEKAHADLAEAHEELETLYEQVRVADRAKSEFLTKVSHELRTPITLVLGPAQRGLEAPDISGGDRERYEVIRRNALQLSSRVDDLLQVASLESGTLEVDYREEDLAALVREVADHFREAAAARDVELRLEGPPSLPAELDPGKTERILFNLLSNAVKFTPEGGTIRCGVAVTGATEDEDTGSSDQQVFVEVADSGPGVPPDLREEIFERFRQAGVGAERPYEGTGLGLALGRELAELQGGTLAAEDAPEGGALFRLSLPRWAPQDVPRRETEGAEAARSWLASHAPDVSVYREEVQTVDEEEGVAEEERPDGAGAAAGAGTASASGATAVAGITAAEDAPAADAPEILVVEDNRDLARFLAESLSDEYRVRLATGGRRGLDAVLASPPDLLLTDLMMPGFGGERLIRELREEHGLVDLPVVVLSALADDETASRLLREGATDYVRKPVSLAELRARIANHLALHRALRVLRQEVGGDHPADGAEPVEPTGEGGDGEHVGPASAPEVFDLVVELADRKRQLKEAAERNRLLLQEFQHRVGGNLQTIESLLRMQIRRHDSEEARRALSRVRDRIAAMNLVHRQFLDWDHRPGRVELAGFLEELVSVIFRSHEAEVHGYRKRLELQEGVAVVDAADAVALGIIVQELVSNALQHAFPGGRRGVVEVSLARDEAGRVVLRVGDSGVGHDVEEYGAGGEDREWTGGLGLEIVRDLVTQLDGTLERRPRPGGGLQFRIIFVPDSGGKEALV